MLDSGEHPKVAFWVGTGHLYDSTQKDDNTPPEILGNDFKVFTANAILRQERSALNVLSKGLSEPVLIDTSQAKNLGTIPQTFQDKYSKGMNEWDFVILFPDTNFFQRIP